MPGACLSFHLYVCQHIWRHCAQCLCVCTHVEVVMRHEIRHGWSWADMNGGLVLSHRGYTVGCSNTNLSVPLLCVPRGGSVMIFNVHEGGPSPEHKHRGPPSFLPLLPWLFPVSQHWQVTMKCDHRGGAATGGGGVMVSTLVMVTLVTFWPLWK